MEEPYVQEEALSSRYHQPKHVEQFGVEAIPLALKTVRWYDLFLIIINFLINPATILTAGMAVVAGLSFWAAIVAQTLGSLIAFSAYVAMATVGVDYGLPGQVATRMTFGVAGSRWFTSLPRAIASVYWFSFQAIAGSIVIVGVWSRWHSGHSSLIAVSVGFSLGQVIVAVIGYNSLKHLSRIAFPIKILILLVVLGTMMRSPIPSFHLSAVSSYAGRSHGSWPLLALWINGMAASWLTMVTDASDFCRYSRSRRDMWIGTIAAAVIGTIVASFLGAYGAAASLGTQANTFQVVTGVTTNHALLLAIVVLIVMENWTINVLNLYTGGLSLSNIFSRVGRFWTTLIIGVIGILLSTQPAVVQGYLRYTTALGDVFSPIAGVLLADYLFIQRGIVKVDELYKRDGDYWYRRGFHPAAVAWVIVGLFVYRWVPASFIQSLSTLLVTGAGYFATMRWLAPGLSTNSPSLEPASHDVEIAG